MKISWRPFSYLGSSPLGLLNQVGLSGAFSLCDLLGQIRGSTRPNQLGPMNLYVPVSFHIFIAYEHSCYYFVSAVEIIDDDQVRCDRVTKRVLRKLAQGANPTFRWPFTELVPSRSLREL